MVCAKDETDTEFPGGYPVRFADPVPYVPLARRFKFFAEGVWHVASAIPHYELTHAELRSADNPLRDCNRGEGELHRTGPAASDAAISAVALDRAESGGDISDSEPRTNNLPCDLTPEMIEAGMREYSSRWCALADADDDIAREMLAAAYRAMHRQQRS